MLIDIAGHADRPVSVRSTDGVLVVDKRYIDADATEIYAAMEALWHSAFGARRSTPGMPQPLAFADGVLTMGFVAGEPVGQRGDPGRSAQLAEPCAQLLADLHGSGVAVRRRRSYKALLNSVGRKAESLRSAASPLAGPYCEVIEALASRLSTRETLVISHGDFSPRNVIASEDGPVLIDFDRLQMASPARDVSYWTAWLWATAAMQGETPSWSAGDSFVAHYRRSAPPWAGVELDQAMRPHRALSLLRIAEGWSSLRVRPDVAAAVIGEARHQATA